MVNFCYNNLGNVFTIGWGIVEKEIIREYTACFTGHRPEKMGRSEQEVKALLNREIDRAVGDGFDTFITGMARGVDLWAAELIVERKNEKNFCLICALPYPGFGTGWDQMAKKSFQLVLEQADLVETVHDSYVPYCFQERNIWMVDHSRRVIAAYNGTKGGTRNTILYAEKQKTEVCNILNGGELIC